MKKKLLLVLCGVIVGLLIVEVALWIFWTNPYAGSGADVLLRLRVHPADLNQRVVRTEVDPEVPVVAYRANSRGYLEPAFRFEDPDLTIAFLGASTTECIAVQEQKRFPALVSTLMEETGVKVNALNAAHSGNTLHDSINILLNHVIADKPDVAVLMHAANDTGLLKVDGDYRSRMGREVSVGDLFRYTVQKVSTRWALLGYVRRAVTLEDISRVDPGGAYNTARVQDIEPFRARLEVFVASCKAFGIVPVLMTQPVVGTITNKLTPQWVDPDAQEAFNQVTRDVAGATNTELVDLAEYIATHTTDEAELRRIFYDGLHVTDYGSELYASYVTEHIRRILPPPKDE